MPPTLAYSQRDLLNVTCALRLLGVQFNRLYAICTCRLTLRIPLVGIFWRQKCNYNNVHVTASVYNIYGALYLGVFAGMRPCGVIVLLTELFIAESNTQVYGSLHNYYANHPMQQKGLVRDVLSMRFHLIIIEIIFLPAGCARSVRPASLLCVFRVCWYMYLCIRTYHVRNNYVT